MSDTEGSGEGSYEDLGGDSDCEALSGPLDVKPLQVREPVRLTQEARQPHGKNTYTNTLELKDSKGKAFLAFEDKDMIRWLQFIEILWTFPIGWVDGVCSFFSFSSLSCA